MLPACLSYPFIPLSTCTLDSSLINLFHFLNGPSSLLSCAFAPAVPSLPCYPLTILYISFSRKLSFTTTHLQVLMYLSVWRMSHSRFYISSFVCVLASLLREGRDHFWLGLLFYFQAPIKCLLIGSKCLCNEPTSFKRAQSDVSVTRISCL